MVRDSSSRVFLEVTPWPWNPPSLVLGTHRLNAGPRTPPSTLFIGWHRVKDPAADSVRRWPGFRPGKVVSAIG